jgi:hypothetical protein
MPQYIIAQALSVFQVFWRIFRPDILIFLKKNTVFSAFSGGKSHGRFFSFDSGRKKVEQSAKSRALLKRVAPQ